MGNATSLYIAHPSPLLSPDAAGVTADVLPHPEWQPSYLLKTNLAYSTTPGAAGITANGDTWRILVTPPGNMQGMAFYPICLRANLWCHSDYMAGLGNFFEPAVMYSIHDPSAAYVWDAVTSDGLVQTFDGTDINFVISVTPDMAGFPPRHGIAESGTNEGNALAGFQFTVKTWSPTTAPQLNLTVDARFLGFPRSAVRSAGFYAARLGFKCV